MATSLKPCPVCTRPMDYRRPICLYCQQAGHAISPSPNDPTIQIQPPDTQPAKASGAQAAITAIGVAVGAGLIVWRVIAGLASIDPATTTTPPPAPAPPKFTISTQGWEYDRGTEIVGTVTNNTSEQMGYVQVTYPLFNKQGQQVGSAMDNVNNVAPRGTWKFRAHVFDDKEVHTYGTPEVSGF
jgi:hypothetical protein